MASARKPLSFGSKAFDLTRQMLIVPEEEGTANSVPAAAVIQRSQALFGFTGRKGCVGGRQVRCEISELNSETALDTFRLEVGRGDWNSRCSSEMRRYRDEHQWRRRVPGPILTLRHESQGSKRD